MTFSFALYSCSLEMLFFVLFLVFAWCSHLRLKLLQSLLLLFWGPRGEKQSNDNPYRSQSFQPIILMMVQHRSVVVVVLYGFDFFYFRRSVFVFMRKISWNKFALISTSYHFISFFSSCTLCSNSISQYIRTYVAYIPRSLVSSRLLHHHLRFHGSARLFRSSCKHVIIILSPFIVWMASFVVFLCE